MKIYHFYFFTEASIQESEHTFQFSEVQVQHDGLLL